MGFNRGPPGIAPAGLLCGRTADGVSWMGPIDGKAHSDVVGAAAAMRSECRKEGPGGGGACITSSCVADEEASSVIGFDRSTLPRPAHGPSIDPKSPLMVVGNWSIGVRTGDRAGWLEPNKKQEHGRAAAFADG